MVGIVSQPPGGHPLLPAPLAFVSISRTSSPWILRPSLVPNPLGTDDVGCKTLPSVEYLPRLGESDRSS